MAYVAFTEDQFMALDDFLTELAEGGSATLVPKTITENGTYDPADDSADGYGEVTVNVRSATDDAIISLIEGTSVVIPYGTTKIKSYMFIESSDTSTVQIPDTVTEVESYAFQKANVKIQGLPDSITKIGGSAFKECDVHANKLPSGLTKIESGTFYGASNLTINSFPEGLTAIDGEAFRASGVYGDIVLPSSLTSIGYAAFYGCDKITSVSCDGQLTSIGSQCFCGANSVSPSKLARASFPHMAVSAFSTTFQGGYQAQCKNLRYLDIGSTQSIQSKAMQDLYALTELVLRREDNICTLQNVNAFTNTPMSGYNNKNGTVYVPQALIETYKAATNWSTLYSGGHLTFAPIEGSQWELDE